MTKRPSLDKNLDSKIFRDFYYLKKELVDFCRENGLPVSGGKIDITDRIAYFLDSGKVLSATPKKKKATVISNISKDTKIEPNFVCSEQHRVFF
ncbi:SAP domain-containing protein [Enterococcus sp. BWT-B8]|nr:SAP domain-containing protein [Enterococcus sp. BWT-B8]MCB5952426.1 SAP domain-containing protein [Enterococcus sp. BWT-B8]